MPAHFRDTSCGTVLRVPLRADSGQASVELVALLPLLAVLAAGVWQLALAGHAVWASGVAARAGARAAAVSGDAEPAALRILPRALRAGARVRTAQDGEVRVTVPVRWLLGGRRLASVSTTARFAAQR
jgi:hypothetical protein